MIEAPVGLVASVGFGMPPLAGLGAPGAATTRLVGGVATGGSVVILVLGRWMAGGEETERNADPEKAKGALTT